MLSEQRVLSVKQRVVEFIGSSRGSNYCDFIVDSARPKVLELLLQWLVEHDREWDQLRFADIPDISNRVQELLNFFKHKGYLQDARVG